MQNQTALIYSYKTKDAAKWGLNPEIVSIAYQVRDDSAIHAHYQCDWGRDMTYRMLNKFKEEGGIITLVKSESNLIIPLHPTKLLTLPVSQELLKEWELSDLLSKTVQRLR